LQGIHHLTANTINPIAESLMRHQPSHHHPSIVESPAEPAWDHQKFIRALQTRATRKKKIILVAEDNASQREIAKCTLKEEYKVVVASHGFEVLELYNAWAPDLVLLDILMPHMDGVSALKRIIAADPAAHVVMFSTLSSEEMVKIAIKLGAKSFVTKPFTSQTIIGHVRRTLKEHR